MLILGNKSAILSWLIPFSIVAALISSLESLSLYPSLTLALGIKPPPSVLPLPDTNASSTLYRFLCSGVLLFVVLGLSSGTTCAVS